MQRVVLLFIKHKVKAFNLNIILHLEKDMLNHKKKWQELIWLKKTIKNKM